MGALSSYPPVTVLTSDDIFPLAGSDDKVKTITKAALAAALGGGASLEVTDGTTSVAAVTSLTVSGGTVSSTGTGEATLTVTGGSGGGAAGPYIGVVPSGFTRPAASAFTLLNLTGGTTVADYADGPMVCRWQATSPVADMQIAYITATDEGPFERIMFIESEGATQTWLYLGGNSDTNMVWAGFQNGQFYVQKWSSPSAFNSQTSVDTYFASSSYWVKVRNNGDTTFNIYVSSNGLSWTEMGANLNGVTGGPVNIGICANNTASGHNLEGIGYLWHYAATTPSGGT